ncbi:MAG: glucan biosynthesis protein [Devosia sp.]|nr:glucan biosynthesis protein [Devosia sp.]
MSFAAAYSYQRRSVLKLLAAGALLGTTHTKLAFAEGAPAIPFDFDMLTERVRTAAQRSFVPSAAKLPAGIANLDYDAYRKIQFVPEHAMWAESDAGYQVHAYHLGWLYLEPVQLFEVADGGAVPMSFTAGDFDYHDAAVGAAAASDFPGVAGFRVNYPINHAAGFDELVSFLGASYFRSLGRGNIYGASARGLVLNSWRDGNEEFPRFSEFYLERPTAGAPLAINAVLDSPSVAGAYRFEITPAGDAAQETTIDVTARLFFRSDVTEIGVAPLTSMYLFSEANRADFDDYRPQVHDSNGLLIERPTGEVMWRALNNSVGMGNSYLWEDSPTAFGLYQRGRDFSSYEDAGAQYERRPSIRIEPVGAWGTGTVRLIEIPSRLEVEDNVVAFWVPSAPVKAGEAREFRYRMVWGDLDPDNKLAYVAETRIGQGGISGVASATNLRKFVIDFKGGELDAMPADTQLDVLATVSAGTVVSTTLFKVVTAGVWRLVLDVDTKGADPLELKAYLIGLGRKLTETWLYQWRATA